MMFNAPIGHDLQSKYHTLYDILTHSFPRSIIDKYASMIAIS